MVTRMLLVWIMTFDDSVVVKAVYIRQKCPSSNHRESSPLSSMPSEMETPS